MTVHTLDHARDVLTLAGYDINETRNISHGWQLRCAGGEVVCVYFTGKVVSQGKGAAAVKALFMSASSPSKSAPRKPKIAAPRPEPEEAREKIISRRPANWSDVWAPGDVPF